MLLSMTRALMDACCGKSPEPALASPAPHWITRAPHAPPVSAMALSCLGGELPSLTIGYGSAMTGPAVPAQQPTSALWLAWQGHLKQAGTHTPFIFRFQLFSNQDSLAEDDQDTCLRTLPLSRLTTHSLRVGSSPPLPPSF